MRINNGAMSVASLAGFFLTALSPLFASPVLILVDSFSQDSFTGTSTTDGTTIEITSGSTLSYLDQSSAGNALINIDGTSQLNFSQTASNTYSGLLSGSGSIVKNGSGNLSMTGNNAAFLGPLSVQVGTLILTGNYGGNVTSSPGASIVYGGAISGDLIVSGSLSTNGIRTLSVGGNYTQLNGAVYLAAISGSGQSTLIDIASTASIDGFVQVDTSAGVLINHTYTLLHANGGVSGTYSLINNNPLFKFSLTYDPFNVYLSFATDFQAVAVTQNEKNVAKQLNSITNPNSDEIVVLSAFASLTPSEARVALNRMSGEQYSNFILTAWEGDARFNQSIYNAYRGNVTACTHSCSGINTWVSGSGGRGIQKGSSAESGFNFYDYMIDTGVHACIRDAWLVGGALGYEFDRVHSHLAGRADLQTGHLGVYSAYQSKHVYVLADLIGGKTWSDYQRPISFGTIHRFAKSHLQIKHGRFDLQVGTNLGSCRYLFQPYIAGSAQGLYQNDIHEQGASSLNLKVKPIQKWFATSDVGVHINFHPTQKIAIDLDLAWEHAYGNLRVSEQTHFEEFGSWFWIQGPKRGHDGGVGSLFISSQLTNSWNFYIETSGEIWKNWHSYALNGGLSYQW
ncbi:MAG: autotransporter domain-containing protein [Rhabdochlamydiaceae bacterium]|nr:autotransporter domain-containing protein [Rhabdochlamydiaceae bacterium]